MSFRLLSPEDTSRLSDLLEEADEVRQDAFLVKEDPKYAEDVFLVSQLKRLDLSYALKVELLSVRYISGSYWWAFNNLNKRDLLRYLEEFAVEPKHFPYIVEHPNFPLSGFRRIVYKHGYTEDENQQALFEQLLESGYFTPKKLLKLASFVNESGLDEDRVAELLRDHLGLSPDVPSSWVIRIAGKR